MVVTLSDDEVSNHEFGSDEDGNFIAFIAIVIVDKSVVVDENPSDRELFRVLICKKLIISFKGYCKGCNECWLKFEDNCFDKKNLLLKLFDATELIDKVKTENMLLLDKV